MTSFISQKFKFWSFVSMVLLVFVHGYNLQDRYLQPWTLPGESLTITSFIEYWLANGLFRFRIPMLFIISGYLYAAHDATPNKERIGKRFKSLLVPYFVWSAIALLLCFAFELSPLGKRLLAQTHMLQIDEQRMFLHEYHWYEVIGRWLFFPVAYQLWFIRVLFFYNLAYPAIRWCVLHAYARWIFFTLAFLFWLSTGGLILIEGEGLLFFSLGVWIQKTNFSIETPAKYLKPVYWGVAFVTLSLLKTWLVFEGQSVIGEAVYPMITLLHKVVIVCGLITCWFGLDQLVRLFMNLKWFVWLASFSFFIYALHAPWVAIFIDALFEWLNFMVGYRMITFVLLPLLVIGICVLLGAALRRISPATYQFLTGGRGM
jgi:fucose 4-O-acetylase-like acetyltransferase